jgi:uncharacterized protein involved in cysteine biosynthesis
MRWITVASLVLLAGVIMKATTLYDYVQYWLVPVCVATGVLLLVRREQARDASAKHLAPGPTRWPLLIAHRAKHL